MFLEIHEKTKLKTILFQNVVKIGGILSRLGVLSRLRNWTFAPKIFQNLVKIGGILSR